MIRAFILLESRTTRMRIQLNTTRDIKVFLNEVANTIIWTRNNNGTITDNNSGLEQEHRTRGQTGIQIDRCWRYMTKHVWDLMSSDMELDVV